MSSTQLIQQTTDSIGQEQRRKSECHELDSSRRTPVIVRRASKEVNAKQKAMLLYLVRMGSFQCPNPRMPPMCDIDESEEDIVANLMLNEIENVEQMLTFCALQLSSRQSDSTLIARKFINKANIIEDADSIITVMQWNILSQAMGSNYEKFETCSEQDMQWSIRKWKLVMEMLQYNCDVICLQEVDQFDFLHDILSKVGYEGRFVPKPDSPCYYISNNSGPDGCAIFWRSNKIELVSVTQRTLEVYQCESNQVAICCRFKWKITGQEFGVATTHLKARKGPVLSALRNEQGKDLLNFISSVSTSSNHSIPIILTGDFNAEPDEPVYNTMRRYFSSAYCDGLNQEPSFTNWTKRENESECKRTLDYIFYSQSQFEVISLLLPESNKLDTAIPNSQYPSDHLSLVARFRIKNNAMNCVNRRGSVE